MITLLIVLIAMILTYLVADYRRYWEIRNLKAAYAEAILRISKSSYNSGFDEGAHFMGHECKPSQKVGPNPFQ